MRSRKGLVAVAASVSLLAVFGSACGASTGTVTGALEYIGGPPTLGSRPVGGAIRISGSTATFSTQANSDGRFSEAVPPGTYTIEGRPDNWVGSPPRFPCEGGHSVVVSAGVSVTLNVECATP